MNTKGMNIYRSYLIHVNMWKQTSQHLNLVHFTLMESVHNVCKQITDQHMPNVRKTNLYLHGPHGSIGRFTPSYWLARLVYRITLYFMLRYVEIHGPNKVFSMQSYWKTWHPVYLSYLNLHSVNGNIHCLWQLN